MFKGLIVILWISLYMIYKGVVGKRKVEQLQKDVLIDTKAKEKFYIGSLRKTWTRTILLVLFGVFVLGMGWKEFGINAVSFNTEHLGIFSYLVIGLVVLYVAFISHHVITCLKKEDYTFKNNDTIEEETDTFRVVLPTNEIENKWWNVLSFTAGFTEELIFRSFLMFIILELFTGMPVVLAGVLTALLFGCGHMYQGLSGFITTSLVGLIFVFLFIILESIIPLILIHWLMDYAAKYSKFFMLDKDKIEEGTLKEA